jgi:bifunctional ADP-heptose synthase (sugar kinase/adenylyltransferase)
VIVTEEAFPELHGKVAMVDGGFDPLHPGHVGYFRAAAALGAPVFCSVSPDAWVARKHAVLLLQDERIALIDAIRFVDYTYAAQSTTAEVLALLRPRFYVKGDDWRDRLPQEELDVCTREGIEVVFLDTVTNSSTELLRRQAERG